MRFSKQGFRPRTFTLYYIYYTVATTKNTDSHAHLMYKLVSTYICLVFFLTQKFLTNANQGIEFFVF